MEIKPINSKINFEKLIITSENKELFNCKKRGLKKVFYGLFIYIYDNIKNNKLYLTPEGYYEILWIDFVKQSFFMTSKDLNNHKGLLKELLFLLSQLSIEIEDENKLIYIRQLFSITFTEEKILRISGVADKFYLKPYSNELFETNTNIYYKNLKILNHQKGFKLLNKTFLFDNIDHTFNNLNKDTCIIKLEDCFNELNLFGTEKQKLRSLKYTLEEGVSCGYFKKYEINLKDKTILIGKNFKVENKSNLIPLKNLNILESFKEIILNKNSIDKEKELNDIIFAKLKKLYEKKYKIEQEFLFKANGRICKVDTVLFNKNDKTDIIFIEYKKTKDKRAPAQVLGYTGLYEYLNKLPVGTIKAVVIQNEFTEYDLGFLNSVSNLFFYKYNIKNFNLSLSPDIFNFS